MNWTIECELDAIIHDAELAIQEICSSRGVGILHDGPLRLETYHFNDSPDVIKICKEVFFVPF